ncbi:hypothetical protein GCM10027347_56610 [Larkinella harenae]
MPKGTFTYNNYYLLINSASYQVTNRVSVGAGVCILPVDVAAPPFSLQLQYSLPITNTIHLAANVTYYQVKYKPVKKGGLLAPQVLITAGNAKSNGTFGVSVLRGNLAFHDYGNGVAVAVPNKINLISSIAYSRHLFGDISLITQNHFIQTAGFLSKNYSNVWFLSLGGRLDYKRNAVKVGIVKLHYPNGDQVRFSRAYPFIGYSVSMKK